MSRVSYLLIVMSAVGTLLFHSNIGYCAPLLLPQTSLAAPSQPAPEFPEGMEWLNAEKPVTLQSLRGKVVLLDFWTYCCINCMHIIPDLKKLEAKYPKELVVIGVHSAKFFNEKDSEGIREAVLRYELEHPVVNDSDLRIWNSFGVNAWPTLVLIDPSGQIVGSVSGEGNFTAVDQAISQVIREAESKGILKHGVMPWKLERDNRPKPELLYPGKIAIDPQGERLFISDSNHNRIVVASKTGEIRETIGGSVSGFKDGDYATARFFRPQGVCFDSSSNRLYVADTENHAIRCIDFIAHTVTTLAGTGRKSIIYPPAAGHGRSASLSSPWDLTLLKNVLYIAMAGSHQLWTLDLKTLEAAPYAGTGGEDLRDGPAKTALLAQPSGITTDGSWLYFADSEVSALRKADLKGKKGIQTLIGHGLFVFGDIDGDNSKARLQHPIGIAVHEGKIYLADTYNHQIRRYDPETQMLKTLIGAGKRGMSDGPAQIATLNEPNGLAFAGNKLYITDTNNSLIRTYDLKTDVLSTLTVRAPARSSASKSKFTGTVLTLPEETLSPDAKQLTLMLTLPPGTQFNLEAPFQIEAAAGDGSVLLPDVSLIKKPAEMLQIPIKVHPGTTRLSLDLAINYCAHDNAGLCYFKEVRLSIPIKVAAGGKSLLELRHSL